MSGRDEEAREALETYHQRRVRTEAAPDSLVALGDAYARKGDYARALQRYLRVEELRPGTKDAAEALMKAARTLVTMGDFQRALKLLRRLKADHAKDLGATMEELEFLISLCLANSGRATDTAWNIRLFLQKYKDSLCAPKALYLMAEALFNQKRHAAALKVYSRFLKQHREDANATKVVLRLAQCYHHLGLYASAGESFWLYVKRPPNYADLDGIILTAARDFLIARRATAALKVLARLSAPEGTPKRAEATLLRAEALMILGQYPEAARELRAAEGKLPTGLRDRGRAMLAECYQRAGLLDRAARVMILPGKAAPPRTKGKEEKEDEPKKP